MLVLLPPDLGAGAFARKHLTLIRAHGTAYCRLPCCCVKLNPPHYDTIYTWMEATLERARAAELYLLARAICCARLSGRRRSEVDDACTPRRKQTQGYTVRQCAGTIAVG